MFLDFSINKKDELSNEIKNYSLSYNLLNPFWLLLTRTMNKIFFGATFIEIILNILMATTLEKKSKGCHISIWNGLEQNRLYNFETLYIRKFYNFYQNNDIFKQLIKSNA